MAPRSVCILGVATLISLLVVLNLRLIAERQPGFDGWKVIPGRTSKPEPAASCSATEESPKSSSTDAWSAVLDVADMDIQERAALNALLVSSDLDPDTSTSKQLTEFAANAAAFRFTRDALLQFASAVSRTSSTRARLKDSIEAVLARQAAMEDTHDHQEAHMDEHEHEPEHEHEHGAEDSHAAEEHDAEPKPEPKQQPPVVPGPKKDGKFVVELTASNFDALVIRSDERK